jgi:hypothetical protein
MTVREELALLLEERTRSLWERRRRRLQRIPKGVLTSALNKAWKASKAKRESVHGGPAYAGEIQPLTLDEYIVLHFGFLPGERDLELRLRRDRGCEQGR